MKASDHGAQTRRVGGRRWVRWHRRLEAPMSGAFAMVPGDLVPVDPGADPIAAIVLVLALIRARLFVVQALIAGFEFSFLPVLLPFALLGRAAFGRWTVHARRGLPLRWVAPAGDRRAGGRRIADVAAAMTRGDTPPHAVDPDAYASPRSGSQAEPQADPPAARTA